MREVVHKFRDGEFDVKNKESSGRPIVYQDPEMKALLEENSSKTQEELALTLGIFQAISYRLKSLRMIKIGFYMK